MCGSKHVFSWYSTHPLNAKWENQLGFTYAGNIECCHWNTGGVVTITKKESGAEIFLKNIVGNCT